MFTDQVLVEFTVVVKNFRFTLLRAGDELRESTEGNKNLSPFFRRSTDVQGPSTHGRRRGRSGVATTRDVRVVDSEVNQVRLADRGWDSGNVHNKRDGL